MGGVETPGRRGERNFSTGKPGSWWAKVFAVEQVMGQRKAWEEKPCLGAGTQVLWFPSPSFLDQIL